MGALLAATSSYELDRLCAWMLGLEEKELPYLTAAKQRRLLSEAGEPLGMKDAAPLPCKRLCPLRRHKQLVCVEPER